MKKVINLVLSVSFMWGIISCGSSVDSSLPPSERIQGTWKIVKAEGEMAETNKGTKYIWDGKMMTTSKNGFDVKGEFTSTDSTILWTAGTLEMHYKYHFEESTLVIELGKHQKFFLNKE